MLPGVKFVLKVI